ncbi:MAG: DUF4115 domain-containing protein [Gammaproteobacteria bacterium]|nr:DUF4115 domain-containing protein [Gammaproteobacteria bacterium]
MNANPRDVVLSTDGENPEGPGAQLREARHRAGYSIEDVATELHLNADTVRALEDGRFDGLPAPAFVRGYLRSYARLLNLPADPILDAYDQQGFEPPTIVPDITQQPQAKSTDVPVRLVTYLVAAGLTVMVVMWWQSRQSAHDVIAEAPPPVAEAGPKDTQPAFAASVSEGPVAAVQAPEKAPSASESRVAAAAPVPGAPDRFGGSPEEASAVPGADLPSDPSPPNVADTPPTTLAAVPPVAEMESSSAADAAADNATPAESTASTEPVSEPEQATVEPVPGNRLGLEFDRESWVEVYDGNGDRLVYQLAIAGERMTLEAVPPIRVVLGYAAGATVTFNDRAIDVTPFMHRGMARFVVAPDGTARVFEPEAGNAGGSATAAVGTDLSVRN